METITLISSHGSITAKDDGNNETATVIECDLGIDWDTPYPVTIDIKEWKNKYPDEDPFKADHDILDFGYWDETGEYIEPCEEWREEKELYS
jgi:hypothetical protein